MGVLSFTTPRERFTAILGALRKRGYEEARSLEIDFGFAEGQSSRLDRMAAELVARKPDLILALNTPDIAAAVRATRTIPM